MSPTIFIVSEGLQAPPRAGFHIHLLSLAHGLAGHTRVRAFAWLGGQDPAAWEAWADTLPAGPHPTDYVVGVGNGGRRGNALRRKIAYWRRVQAHLAREARPGDVLWVRDLSTAFWAVPSLTRWLPARGEMRHLYDASSLLDLESGLRPDALRHRMMASLEGRIRRNFDLVRTLGVGMREHLERSGVDPKRILVAPVGAFASPNRRAPSTGLRRLLYIGSASRWQGLGILVEAMRGLRKTAPELRLTVAGISLQSAPELATEPNIDVKGWVDRAALPDLYATHDLLVIPRPDLELTQRVLPMKCVEAQAHGIPILASDLEAIREVTAAESAALVQAGSPGALVEGIQRLAADPQQLDRMHEAALRRRERFEWDHIAGAILTDLAEMPR